MCSVNRPISQNALQCCYNVEFLFYCFQVIMIVNDIPLIRAGFDVFHENKIKSLKPAGIFSLNDTLKIYEGKKKLQVSSIFLNSRERYADINSVV